jgi:hypothetical protein
MTVTAADAEAIGRLEAEPAIRVVPVFSRFVNGPDGMTKDPTLVDVEIEIESAALAETRIRQIVGDGSDVGAARPYRDDS